MFTNGLGVLLNYPTLFVYSIESDDEKVFFGLNEIRRHASQFPIRDDIELIARIIK